MAAAAPVNKGMPPKALCSTLADGADVVFFSHRRKTQMKINNNTKMTQQ